jgi:hypothetical protein
LPVELAAEDLFSPQPLPQMELSVRGMCAQRARSGLQSAMVW